MSLRAFAATADAIYYAPEDTGRKNTIERFDLGTGNSRTVATTGLILPRPLSVAPDGSFLLYSQLDRAVQSLLLVENFH